LVSSDLDRPKPFVRSNFRPGTIVSLFAYPPSCKVSNLTLSNNVKKLSYSRHLQTLAAALWACTLLFAAAAAQAEPRPATTSHVPEAVASGVAPLVGHLPGTQRLSLAISLPLRSEAELDDLLQQL